MKKDINSEDIRDNHGFKDSWTLENAMHILQHPTVDSKIWAEAVEWLMLYGPKEVQHHLLAASQYATSKQYPQLVAAGCTKDGEVCYSLEDIAEALGTDVEETKKVLAEKEKSHNRRHGFSVSETHKVQ